MVVESRVSGGLRADVTGDWIDASVWLAGPSSAVSGNHRHAVMARALLGRDSTGARASADPGIRAASATQPGSVRRGASDCAASFRTCVQEKQGS